MVPEDALSFVSWRPQEPLDAQCPTWLPSFRNLLEIVCWPDAVILCAHEWTINDRSFTRIDRVTCAFGLQHNALAMHRLAAYRGRGIQRVTLLLEALARSHWQTMAALNNMLGPIASRRLGAKHLSALKSINALPKECYPRLSGQPLWVVLHSFAYGQHVQKISPIRPGA